MIADNTLLAACKNLLLLLAFCFFGNQSAIASISLVQDTVYVGEMDAFCGLVNPQPGTSLKGIKNFCEIPNPSVVEFSLDANNCLNYNALVVGSAQACIEVNYGAGNLDTILVNVVVEEAPPAMINVTVETGSTPSYCGFPLNKYGSDLKGIVNTCEENSPQVVSFAINGSCLDYNALAPGTGQACLSLNYGGGNIDEILFNVTVEDPPVPAPATIDVTVEVGATPSYCGFPLNKYGSDLKGITNTCEETSPQVVSFDINGSCLDYNALAAGTGQACLSLNYGGGNIDEILFNVTVENPPTPEINVTIGAGSMDSYCGFPLNKYGSDLKGITNTCEETSPQVVAFDINGYCLDYNGILPGTGQACLSLNYGGGNIDEILFNVTVLGDPVVLPRIINDTLIINQAASFCGFSLSKDGSAIRGAINYCDGGTPNNVDYDIVPQSYCLDYTANALGEAEACIELNYGSAGRDTILYQVFVRNPEPDFASVEVDEGEITMVCAENIELFGNIESALSVCGTVGVSDITYDGSGLCFSVEGLEVGTDLACFEICDDNGVCNTFEIEVNVLLKETFTFPVAQNDSVTAIVGELNQWSICANDSINSDTLSSIRVVPGTEGGAGPFGGTITFPEDGACEMVYEPFQNSCGFVDSILYEICNEYGCDSAMVYVTIECSSEEESPKVLSGFSPNGDNINETLYIVGLEEYPDHTLTILNRYGAQLLETKNYQNDWRGDWDGKILPDGTYYYVLETGEGNVKTGWFNIQR